MNVPTGQTTETIVKYNVTTSNAISQTLTYRFIQRIYNLDNVLLAATNSMYVRDSNILREGNNRFYNG